MRGNTNRVGIISKPHTFQYSINHNLSLSWHLMHTVKREVTDQRKKPVKTKGIVFKGKFSRCYIDLFCDLHITILCTHSILQMERGHTAGKGRQSCGTFSYIKSTNGHSTACKRVLGFKGCLCKTLDRTMGPRVVVWVEHAGQVEEPGFCFLYILTTAGGIQPLQTRPRLHRVEGLRQA